MGILVAESCSSCGLAFQRDSEDQQMPKCPHCGTVVLKRCKDVDFTLSGSWPQKEDSAWKLEAALRQFHNREIRQNEIRPIMNKCLDGKDVDPESVMKVLGYAARVMKRNRELRVGMRRLRRKQNLEVETLTIARLPAPTCCEGSSWQMPGDTRVWECDRCGRTDNDE